MDLLEQCRGVDARPLHDLIDATRMEIKVRRYIVDIPWKGSNGSFAASHGYIAYPKSPSSSRSSDCVWLVLLQSRSAICHSYRICSVCRSFSLSNPSDLDGRVVPMVEPIGARPTVPRRQCHLNGKKSRKTGPIGNERMRYAPERVAYSKRPFVPVTVGNS